MNNIRTIDENLELLRRVHISTPRETELLRHLARVLRKGPNGEPSAEAARFTATGETRGILVIGEPGDGKSSLVAHGLSKHPALGDGPTGTPRFVDALVPTPGTLKNMGAEILDKTGYQKVSGRRDAFDIWKLVRKRLTFFGYTVLWIDEAHDLFAKDQNQILRALKALMQGDDAVIVILSGTRALAQIVRSDAQVQRRFSVLSLPKVSVANDLKQFDIAISSYCGKVGLEWCGDTTIVERLFHGSRYVFGRSIEIIIKAIEEALIDGSEQLGRDHFAMAWAMDEGCSADQNVFMADEWWAIQLDVKDEEPTPNPKRGKRKSS